MSINILLAEDHIVVREGLRNTIEKNSNLKVVGEASDGIETVQLAQKLAPDVIIMDITMPNLNGIEATREIVGKVPGTKVIALSMHAEDHFVIEMLKAGASGYLVKQSASSEMLMAIHAVVKGQTFLSPFVTGPVIKGFLADSSATPQTGIAILAPREREVLQLLAEGKSTKEIGNLLNIAATTVETHRRQIKEKLHIDSMAGLVKFAVREGLVSLDS